MGKCIIMVNKLTENDAMHYVGLQAEMPISNKLMTGLAYHNIRSGELEDTQQILEVAENINWIIILN